MARIKIISTIRAGRVVRQILFTPKELNPNQTRRGIGISKEDKLRANLKTSYEKLLMLVCANFSPGDWWVTLSYDDAHLPKTKEESKRPFRRFIRRFRKYRKVNKEALKYVYCTQLTTRDGGIRLHHHMILRWEDDSDKEQLYTLWEGGEIVYARKLKDFEDILAKVHYMCREPRELGVHVSGEQMWTASRGLIRPKPEYIRIDNDSIDINIPVGCTQLSEPVQIPGYGGYKAILYYEKI